jgi:hypothetical protein
MQFTSWQTVKVTDQGLQSFGRAGRVTSASEYKDGKKEVVDVLLDDDKDPTVFEVSQVAAVG